MDQLLPLLILIAIVIVCGLVPYLVKKYICPECDGLLEKGSCEKCRYKE